MRAPWFFAAAAVAVALPASAQQRMPREAHLHRTGLAGQELRIFTYTAFSRDCAASPAPQIIIGVQPAHGTLAIRPGEVVATVLRENAPDCTGRSYPGTAVWYTPLPGFHGSDRFDYRVVYLNNTDHDTVTVDIR